MGLVELDENRLKELLESRASSTQVVQALYDFVASGKSIGAIDLDSSKALNRANTILRYHIQTRGLQDKVRFSRRGNRIFLIRKDMEQAEQVEESNNEDE